MKERAYAKINLSLDICGKRDDGYHELDSLMLPIDFYDLVEINIASQDSYECNWRTIRYNEHNSIYKMFNIIKERYYIDDHHEIRLEKSVPIQAGLGGGTSDAAATLRILQRMYHLDLSDNEIKDICNKVGADVLFNYYNVPARVKGIGDIIEPIEVGGEYYILLLKPRSGVSTQLAYQQFDINNCDHPDIDRLLAALKNGEDLDGLLANSLQKVAQTINDDIRILLEKLKDNGARNYLMSGSGSSVFCISLDNNEIMNLYHLMKDDDYYIRFGKILNN